MVEDGGTREREGKSHKTIIKRAYLAKHARKQPKRSQGGNAVPDVRIEVAEEPPIKGGFRGAVRLAQEGHHMKIHLADDKVRDGKERGDAPKGQVGLEGAVHVLHAIHLEGNHLAALVFALQVVGVHDAGERAGGRHGTADQNVGRADVVQQDPPGPSHALAPQRGGGHRDADVLVGTLKGLLKSIGAVVELARLLELLVVAV